MPERLFPEKPASVALTDRLEAGIMPLINLVFLLLMFFLLAGVIAEDPLPDLPANAAAENREEPRVDFTVEPGGVLIHDQQPVDLGALPVRLDAIDADRADKPWRLAAHQDLSMADLEKVLAAFDRAGVAEVQLLTEPR